MDKSIHRYRRPHPSTSLPLTAKVEIHGVKSTRWVRSIRSGAYFLIMRKDTTLYIHRSIRSSSGFSRFSSLLVVQTWQLWYAPPRLDVIHDIRSGTHQHRKEPSITLLYQLILILSRYQGRRSKNVDVGGLVLASDLILTVFGREVLA